MWTPRNLKLSTHFSTAPFDPPFPKVRDQLICLAHIEGGVVLAPHCQSSDLPIGRLIMVGDQTYHSCVVSKLNDGVGVVYGHAVVGEQGIQEWTKYKNKALWVLWC